MPILSTLTRLHGVKCSLNYRSNSPIRLNRAHVTFHPADAPTPDEIWHCFEEQEQTFDNPFSSTGLHSHRGVTASVVKVRKKKKNDFITRLPRLSLVLIQQWAEYCRAALMPIISVVAYSLFLIFENRKGIVIFYFFYFDRTNSLSSNACLSTYYK